MQAGWKYRILFGRQCVLAKYTRIMLHKKYFFAVPASPYFKLLGWGVLQSQETVASSQTTFSFSDLNCVNEKPFDAFTQFRDRTPSWSGYEVKVHEAAAHMQIYAF